MAAKIMKFEELHCWMGHILLEATRCLVSEGPIEGIELDKSSQLWSYNLCEYARAICKPIWKIYLKHLMHQNLAKISIQIYGDLLQYRCLERKSIMCYLWMIIHGGLMWGYFMRRIKHSKPTLTLRCGQRPSLGLGVAKCSKQLTVEASISATNLITT